MCRFSIYCQYLSKILSTPCTKIPSRVCQSGSLLQP